MIPICEIQRLPRASGIYKVLNPAGVVIYVGQAKNIHKRWKNGHHKYHPVTRKYGDREVFITWSLMPQWLLNRAENAAVSFYKPEFNQKTPSVV